MVAIGEPIRTGREEKPDMFISQVREAALASVSTKLHPGAVKLTACKRHVSIL